jgi:hypothetical protein
MNNSGSAQIAKARIWEALALLEQAQSRIMTARSNTTDIGIHLNTSSNATSDSIGDHLSAISSLRDAIRAAETALIGTANNEASVALVWLRQVDLTLEEDSVQLNQLKNSIQTLTARAAEIVRNNERSVQHIVTSANALRSEIARLG